MDEGIEYINKQLKSIRNKIKRSRERMAYNQEIVDGLKREITKLIEREADLKNLIQPYEVANKLLEE